MPVCNIHNDEKVARRRSDGRTRFVCLRCEADRLKKHRQSGAAKLADPVKKKAWKIVENAVASGRLKRHPCERCGAVNAHAHHDDYSKPLDVKWLCPQHHKNRHREIECEAA